jgi:diacylglycerol kinase (ATP)
MPRVAVVAHAGKSFGGGLAELREVLARERFTDPFWYEVAKSRQAPKYARRALTDGAEVIFVWGGDGMVQRCIDAVAGTEAVLAILPAGTANLLAANLHVPAHLAEAVRVGLHGDRRPLDTGSVNGEHFAVMAGAGFDARMIKQADRAMKDCFGRAAYLYTGARNLSASRVKAVIEVDGLRFFKGRISCVLAGNVGNVLGGPRRSMGPSPTTGCWNSEWSPPGTRRNGPGRWDESCWARPRGRRSSMPHEAGSSRSDSTGSFPTSLTAGPVRRPGSCGSRFIPPRSGSACPPTQPTDP